MKKVFIWAVVVLVALSLSISMPVLAGEKLKVKGTVTKIDEANKSLTIKTKAGEMVTVIMADADMLAKVEEGGKAKAYYVEEGGVKKGTKLRRLTTGCD